MSTEVKREVYTKVSSESQVKKSILSFNSLISQNIKKIYKDEISISFGTRAIKMQPCDMIRMLSEMHSKDGLQHLFRNIYVNNYVTSEAALSLSGVISTMVYSSLFEKKLGERYNKDFIDSLKRDIRAFEVKNSSRLSSHQALKLLKRYIKSPLEIAIIEEATNIAGAAGRLTIDDSVGTETVVKSFLGNCFEVKTHEVFSNGVEFKHNNYFDNCRVFILDGYIESMSEIERLVQEVFKENCECVIFSRGLSSDVANTLAVNFSRGNLKIVPYVVPFDEEGVNVLSDIACVVGGDVISSLKGEIISSKGVEDTFLIDSATLKHNKIIIEKKDAAGRCNQKVISLRKKLGSLSGNRTYEDEKRITRIYEKRISSLIGNGAQIRLGRALGEKSGIVKDRIRFGTKIFSDYCSQGCTSLKDEVSDNVFLQSVIDSLTNLGISNIPRGSLSIGIDSGLKLYEQMSSVKCSINFS